MSTIKVDTVRPVTTDGSLTLQGDSSGSGVTGITIDSSGNTTATLSSSSNIKAPLNASGDAPVYACRAWVNFSGISPVAIRASGNVSSITRHGNGDYTVNFASAMPDANYVTATQSQFLSHHADATTARTTTAFRFQVRNSSFNFTDYSVVEVCVFK